jgi:anti-anti-sigma factor
MTKDVEGSIKVSETKGCGMLFVKGSFAFHLQQEFRKAYEGLISTSKSIQIDLRDVDYMDSSGLGMLLVMKKYLDKHGVVYEIVNSRGQPLELLLMTHFNQYFKINNDEVAKTVASQ